MRQNLDTYVHCEVQNYSFKCKKVGYFKLYRIWITISWGNIYTSVHIQLGYILNLKRHFVAFMEKATYSQHETEVVNTFTAVL